MPVPRSGERKRALLGWLVYLVRPGPRPTRPTPPGAAFFFPVEDRSTAVLSASSSPDLMTTVSTWLDPTGSRAWVLGGLRLRSGGWGALGYSAFWSFGCHPRQWHGRSL